MCDLNDVMSDPGKNREPGRGSRIPARGKGEPLSSGKLEASPMSREISLVRELEQRLLSGELRPARPVGLRYDRVEKGISDPTSYVLTNALLIARLMAPYERVFVCCEEAWAGDVVNLSAGSGGRTNWVSSEEQGSAGAGREAFDGVVTDSSILLSEDVKARLVRFREMIRPGGRLSIMAVNWEYEMDGREETYETSFRRYGGRIYAGIVKRTMNPPMETEYVCLLNPESEVSRALASMKREELKTLVLSQVPGASEAIVSAELVRIPQFTKRSLEDACRSAGFSPVLVSGAPGMPAIRLAGSAFWQQVQGLRPEEVSRSFALAFPFISSADNPHIIGVCDL